MNPLLEHETEKLTRSWMRHEAGVLRDYLVAGVEDPRLNLQSIFSRHFLTRALMGERYRALMEEEYRFAAAMNWLLKLTEQSVDPEELAAVRFALKHGADKADGAELPRFLVRLYASLPAAAGDLVVPNYLEDFLAGARFVEDRLQLDESSLNTFRHLWRTALRGEVARASVLEPACGSANDYRFLDGYGLAPWLDYTGLDLCSRNIENARALFPRARFEQGNVFDIAAPNHVFDLCFVHDLFEHLSPAGLVVAVEEICRVTRHGLCVGFFNMDEIPEHIIRPVEDYHWNTLSMARMRDLFAHHGFTGQVVNIGAFLRQCVGCERTHNPNAYTFLLSANPRRTAL
jgi:SAM-dependent methyltransferase